MIFFIMLYNSVTTDGQIKFVGFDLGFAYPKLARKSFDFSLQKDPPCDELG